MFYLVNSIFHSVIRFFTLPAIRIWFMIWRREVWNVKNHFIPQFLSSKLKSETVKWHIQDLFQPNLKLIFFSLFQTFCVVSRRFQKHYVQRFSATRSLFIFPPWNLFRRSFVFLSTNQYFDYLVMLTILVNCVFLAMPENNDDLTE